MIRNLFAVALGSFLALIPLSGAMALDSGPGCGVGQMIWDSITPGSKKIIPQILAATTNGTFGNQTFGITTGTLGCSNDGVVMNDQKVNVFASANFDNLKQDMAKGQGEYLASFASLLEIRPDQQAAFFSMTQAKYTSLVPSTSTTSEEMVAALNQELSAHPILTVAAVR